MCATRSIIFFADGSQETHTGLRRILLAQAEGTLLFRFLSSATIALQEELLQVAPQNREGLPDFQSLHELVHDTFDESSRHPALHPTEIVLVQLGHFIASYELQPHEAYPNEVNSVVVGVCFGELSAAAVTLAKSLVELVPLAVEAVRIAFKAGILASTVGNDLEHREYPAESWSATLAHIDGWDDEEKLEGISEQLNIPKHRRPYITAFNRKTITVGAPPSSLRKLLRYLLERGTSNTRGSHREVQIYAPYHAFRYFSREHVHTLLSNSKSIYKVFDDESWDETCRTFLGSADGDYYLVTSRRELVKNVVYNILAQPIRWEKVVAGCDRITKENRSVEWRVRPFGQPTLAKVLATSLSSNTKVKIYFDESFGLQVDDCPRAKRFPIAIVGMAARFPGAEDLETFWKGLETGIDFHREIPSDRFDPKSHLKEPAYGCFIDRPGMFDPRFFNVSPKEALQTDPGQRLALTTAYEALEAAGVVPDRTPSTQRSRIGTFNGQVADEYKEQNLAQEVGTHFIPGTMRAFATGRINHFFKFGGPALSIDTACSTSSVALQLACQSIWNRECDTAVVGGMNIISSSDNYVGLSAGHFLSRTGGCKTWDVDADGYCRGEAVASVVIKSLDSARNDNDNILGVLLSTATNYSADAASITRPHGPSQEILFKAVLRDAGLHPFDIDYVEMHGTGTQAGDVVEMNSVVNVFAPLAPVRPDHNPLYIGAVKANVGHGESASGLTGLIKSLLILHKRSLPPHIGIKTTLNPKLPPLPERNVRIPLTLTPLPSKCKRGLKRRILLNNFSAAGGNTACILEEPPKRSTSSIPQDPRTLHVISVTAKTLLSITKNAEHLLEYLERNPSVSLADLSYTTTARRIQHALRRTFVTTSIPDLTKQLLPFIRNRYLEFPQKVSHIGLCFTGQGAFYTPLAEELFNSCQSFRADILRFDSIARTHGFCTFLPLFDMDTREHERLSQTETQLATVALQMALYHLFSSLGVTPNVIIGHSLGEYAAFYVSGVLSAYDVLYLVGHRARLLESKCSESVYCMLAVQSDKETMYDILGGDFTTLEVACANGPNETVLVGPIDVCREAAKQLDSEGVVCRELKVSYGYHSEQMDAVVGSLEQLALSVEFKTPKIPIASPTTGSIIRSTGIINSAYIRHHTRECVRFGEALLQCKKENLTDAASVWVEIGPRPVCLEMIKATLGVQVRTLPSLRGHENSWTAVSKSLSALHSWGCNINWQEYHRDFEHSHQLLPLPCYAWEEKDYWIPYRNDWLLNKNKTTRSPQNSQESDGPQTTTVQKLVSHEVHDKQVALVFETDLAQPEIHAMISGHVMNGAGLCPASIFADIALTIADWIRKNHTLELPSTGFSINSMELLHPIIVSKDLPINSQILRIAASGNLATGSIVLEFTHVSQNIDKDEHHARCLVRYGETDSWLSKWSRSAYLVHSRMVALAQGISNGSTHRLLRGMVYKMFSSTVLYNRKFQGMQEVLINTEQLEAMATLDLHAGDDTGSFYCNPLWIDSLLHLSGFILNVNDTLDTLQAVFISRGWDSLRFARMIDPVKKYKVYVKMQSHRGSTFAGDVFIFDRDMQIGLVKGLTFQKVPRSLLNTLLPNPAFESPAPIKVVPRPQRNVKGEKSFTSQGADSSKVEGFMAVIAEEIGIQVEEIPLDTDLSSLGIDSLLSLTILSRLQNTYQVDLPQDLFQKHTTMKDLRMNLTALICDQNVDEISYSSNSSISQSAFSRNTNIATPGSAVQDVTSLGTASRLRSLIALQVGVEVEELVAADSLSAIGIDSLIGLTIIEIAQKELSITIPPDMLATSRSMIDLEESLNLITNSLPALPTQIHATPYPLIPPSILLQGNTLTAEHTIFLFPDGSGSAASYVKLPKLASNICVFGLNSPFLRAGPEASFTLDQLLDAWVSEIRIRQTVGPYFFGGWSAGGYYAFEATKRFNEAGETIAKLFVIDTPPRNVYESMPQKLLQWLVDHDLMGNRATMTPQSWLVDHFASTLRALDRYIPTALEGSEFPKVYIIWASDGVLGDHDVAGDDLDDRNRVTRFLLRRRTDFGPHGWERLLRNCDTVIAKTPGNHFNMVLPPNVEKLGHLIATAIHDENGQEYEPLIRSEQ